MDWGFGKWTDPDSESTVPELPPIQEQTNQNQNGDSLSKMRPACPSRIENMDDTAPDVEIKEEVGELFMGKSIDEENNQTIFPSGLILIHHQPTMTVTAPEGRTETHFLSYTPVYMDDNGSPSFLQTSTPNTSIIRSSNSEIQFVRQAIPPMSSGGTRFSSVLRPAPKDPLEISPSKANHEVQMDPTAEVTIKNHFVCTLCGIIFNTFVERNEHVLGVHEHISRSPHTPEINPNLTFASWQANIDVPTKDVDVECEGREERRRLLNAEKCRRTRERRRQRETIEERKGEQRTKKREERQRERLANETPEERKSRRTRDVERQRKYLANETLEERTKRLAANAERKRKRLANETPEQRTKRLAVSAEQNRKLYANETEEKRKARLGAKVERQRKKLANETPEERTKRLGDDARRHRNDRKQLADEDEISKQRTAKVADSLQCEYCEISLTSKKSLRGHMIREHSKAEEEKFKCDHCEKAFAIQGDCKTHMLTHSKDKRFICDKCGKGFQNKAGMTSHVIFKHRFDPDVQENYWLE